MRKLTVGLLIGIFSVGAVFAGPTYLSAQEDEDDEEILAEVTVDLKINGSDGPVTVAKRSRITIQWTSEGADSCKGNWNRRNLKESGRQRGRISKSRVFTITCISDDGESASDLVAVNVMGQEPVTAPSITAPTTSTQPSITTISPNQGAANTNVIIQGTNLSTASQVEFYDSTGPKGSLTPTSVSSSQVSFTIDGIFAANMSPGTYGVSVVTSTCKAGCNSNRLSFTITAPTVPPPTTTTSKPLVCGQKGDVNNDGVISEADRERIRAFALGTAAPTDEERAAADVNGNGSVTTLDVSIITNYLLGNVQTFAGCVFVPKPIPASCGTLGDVNFDGKVDNEDIKSARGHIVGTHDMPLAWVNRADVNGKDGLTMLDIAFLRRYLLGLDATFPACTTATTAPSITVLSPNGGESYKIGGNLPVTFEYQNLSGSSYVYLYSPTSAEIPGYKYTFNTTVSGSTGFEINLGNDVTSGQYKIGACDENTPNPVYTFKPLCDLSDSFFTITAPTTPPPTTGTSKPLVCGQKGDVNADGVISEADRERIRAFVLGTAAPTDEERAAADVNGNGSVTTLDNGIIGSYLAGTVQSFTGCVFVPKPTPPSCGTLGDVNFDGKIDNEDIESARGHIVGTRDMPLASVNRADVNGKDGLTMLDIAFLRRYLLGLDATFPACTTATTAPSITTISPNQGAANTVDSGFNISPPSSDTTSYGVEITASVAEPVPAPTVDSLTFTALSSADDKSGGYGFAPGNGPDWSYSATFNLGSAKTIKSMQISAGSEIWTTAAGTSFYNIVVFEGGLQLNTAYGQTFEVSAGGTTFTLYAQKWFQNFNPNYTLTVTFTDGTTLSAPVSGSPVSFWMLFQQFAGALAGLRGR